MIRKQISRKIISAQTNQSALNWALTFHKSVFGIKNLLLFLISRSDKENKVGNTQVLIASKILTLFLVNFFVFTGTAQKELYPLSKHIYCCM